METKIITIDKPVAANLVFGQSHFVKTVEDVHEALVNSVPGIKFGLAFCEASGPALVRTSGTDKKLEKLAGQNALKIGCGHSFLIITENAYPINFINRLKETVEVVNLYCATANPVEVIVGETKNGRAVLGVVDGTSPKRIETESDKADRKALLRKIGYKF